MVATFRSDSCEFRSVGAKSEVVIATSGVMIANSGTNNGKFRRSHSSKLFTQLVCMLHESRIQRM
jgi:hypothetical protein